MWDDAYPQDPERRLDGPPFALRFAEPVRCACGRPVPDTSSCRCCCAECDDAPGEVIP